MNTTLAFDVYGTLIDTHGVVAALQNLVGNRAQAFSKTWRDKQLEYSFRRGLMQNYRSFAVCTSQALDYTCTYHKTLLTDEQKGQLLGIYRILPAFDDTIDALAELKATGYRLYAFSNGSTEAVEMLLRTAGIRGVFDGVVSCEELKSFKPNPGVYSHFLRQAKSTGQCAWLISGNPFDVIGAISAGMKAAWVQRSDDAIFDPWEIEPTITVRNLSELSSHLNE